jgi:glycosyltransferase involved in cell wall biosynthesis
MPEPLTLGYMTSQYARAGDTYVRREVEQMRRLGHAVHTFSIRRADPGEAVSDEIRREQARTEYLLEAGPRRLALAGLRRAIARPRAALTAARAVLRCVPPGIPGRWTRRAAYLLEAAYLAEQMEAKGVQHLHNHIGENSALVAMLASILTGIPYSLTIHGPGEFDRPALLALGEKIRRAAFVVAVSEFTRSQLYRWADYRDWPKIRVIRVGVSPMYLEHGPAPIPAAPRLVNIGRIVEQKGQAILIEAAARLRDRGVDFELAIVGEGPMRGEIERLIEEHGLHGRVRFTGYLGDREVMEELLGARVLVLPSFAEGLPGVFFEAMALGRPVITTAIAAHSELIEPGENGWLVPPGAVGPLVEALAAALAATPADLERMGRAGAARIAERHHPARGAVELAGLFTRSNPERPAPGAQRAGNLPAGNGSRRPPAAPRLPGGAAGGHPAPLEAGRLDPAAAPREGRT